MTTQQKDGVVCIVLPYTGDKQAAERNIQQAFQGSDIPTDELFTFSAKTLSELPHPMQVSDISEWAETSGVLDSRKRYAGRS